MGVVPQSLTHLPQCQEWAEVGGPLAWRWSVTLGCLDPNTCALTQAGSCPVPCPTHYKGARASPSSALPCTAWEGLLDVLREWLLCTLLTSRRRLPGPELTPTSSPSPDAQEEGWS